MKWNPKSALKELFIARMLRDAARAALNKHMDECHGESLKCPVCEMAGTEVDESGIKVGPCYDDKRHADPAEWCETCRERQPYWLALKKARIRANAALRRCTEMGKRLRGYGDEKKGAA